MKFIIEKKEEEEKKNGKIYRRAEKSVEKKMLSLVVIGRFNLRREGDSMSGR